METNINQHSVASGKKPQRLAAAAARGANQKTDQPPISQQAEESKERDKQMQSIPAEGGIRNNILPTPQRQPTSTNPIPDVPRSPLPRSIPNCLAEGGTFDRQVRAATYHADKRIADFAQSQCDQLRVIRQQFSFQPSSSRTISSAENDSGRLRAAVHAASPNSPSAIGEFILHHVKAKSLNEELIERVVREIMHDPDAYKTTFGMLLPDVYWNAAMVELEVLAYRGELPISRQDMDDFSVYIKDLNRRSSGEDEIRGLRTGLATLDSKSQGLSGLTVLGGGPGTGKTLLALGIATNVLRSYPEAVVLFLSLDMSKQAIFDRLMSIVGGVPQSELISPGNHSQRQNQAIAQVQEIAHRLAIVARPANTVIDWNDLTVKRNQLVEEAGASRAVIIVDYLQLIAPPEDIVQDLEIDNYRINELDSFRKRTISREMPDGDVVLVLSEVRKSDSRAELTVSDLLGSGRSGYRPDAVWMLQPASDSPPSGSEATAKLKFRVVKSRVGRRSEMDLILDHERQTILEIGTKRPANPSQLATPPDRRPATKRSRR